MSQPAQKQIRLAVLLSGQGSNAEALAEASQAAEYPAKIVLVASDKPQAPGLGKAQARGLSTWYWKEKSWQTQDFNRPAFESAFLQECDKHCVEALALAGFMRLLSAEFLARFAKTRGAGRVINIHPSLLPKFRGRDAPAQALAAGSHRNGGNRPSGQPRNGCGGDSRPKHRCHKSGG